MSSEHSKFFIALCKKLHSSEKKFQQRRCARLSKLSKISGRTKVIAAIAIFSALYSVIRQIPMGPMIGLSGQFSVSDSLAPLYGIILGPYTGGISIIIGTFLAMAMGKAPVFMGLDFLPALVNAVAIGFLVRRKWEPVVLLNAVLLAVFILNPLTSFFINIPIGNTTVAFPFLWMHFIAYAVLLSPLGHKAGEWVTTLKPSKLTMGIAILAFVGTMMQHLMGNILSEVVRSQILGVTLPEAFPTVIWPSAFIVYPWERLTLIIITVAVGVPLVKALRKSLFPFEKQPPAKVT